MKQNTVFIKKLHLEMKCLPPLVVSKMILSWLLQRRRSVAAKFLCVLATICLLACSSSEEEAEQSKKIPAKPVKTFSLLIQDTVLEGSLAPSVRRGLELAIAQIAQREDGFAKYSLNIQEQRISTSTTVEDIESILEESAAVFAVLDEQGSYLLAQAATMSPVPVLFLNDGPLRTCNPNELNSVLPTVWQLGSTESQAIEPFLISLASELKAAEQNLSFSFFATDALWTRHLSAYARSNVRALGFGVKHQEFLDSRISDFYRPLQQVLRHRANVLYISIFPGFAQSFFEQASKMLVFRDFALATLWILPEERLAAVGEGANRVWTLSRYSPAFLEEEAKLQTLENDREVWAFEGVRELETAHATGAYLALQFLQKAAIKARSSEPVALNAGLSLVSMQSPQSMMWFSRDNHVLTQPLYRVRVRDGAYVDEYYLGDVEHPGLSRCAYSVFKELEAEEEKPYQSMYE